MGYWTAVRISLQSTGAWLLPPTSPKRIHLCDQPSTSSVVFCLSLSLLASLCSFSLLSSLSHPGFSVFSGLCITQPLLIISALSAPRQYETTDHTPCDCSDCFLGMDHDLAVDGLAANQSEPFDASAISGCPVHKSDKSFLDRATKGELRSDTSTCQCDAK